MRDRRQPRTPPSPNHDYMRSHFGKVRYGAHERAEAAVKALRNEGKYGLSAYECKYCGGWHVGH